MLLEQERGPDRPGNPINGLHPISPVLQDWVWPWCFFFVVWEVRQQLLPDDESGPSRVLDVSVQVLNRLCLAEVDFEKKPMNTEGSNIFVPEDRFLPVLNVATADTEL